MVSMQSKQHSWELGIHNITSIDPGIAPNIALTLLVFNSKPFNAKMTSPDIKNRIKKQNILLF